MLNHGNHKSFTLLEHVEFQSQGRKNKVIYKAVQLHFRDRIEKEVHLKENSKKGVISESFHVSRRTLHNFFLHIPDSLRRSRG